MIRFPVHIVMQFETLKYLFLGNYASVAKLIIFTKTLEAGSKMISLLHGFPRCFQVLNRHCSWLIERSETSNRDRLFFAISGLESQPSLECACPQYITWREERQCLSVMLFFRKHDAPLLPYAGIIISHRYVCASTIVSTVDRLRLGQLGPLS